MKNKSKNLRIASYAYFFASAGFYIAALLALLNDSNSAITYLCLGSSMLCLGAATLNESKKDNIDCNLFDNEE